MAERPDRGTATATTEVAVEHFGNDMMRDLFVQAIEALDGPDVEVHPGVMSTVVSGDLDAVLHAVERAHTTAFRTAGRVITTVRLESRDGGIDFAERARQVDRTQAP
ncbi:MAG TPA: thiamine-binding protein [Euzebyales bacterium]|nr:thiamine-binding protein [Euzebyales bacterium]